ncbi:hypothetical protein CapIbe_004077 [Capra ibex]
MALCQRARTSVSSTRTAANAPKSSSSGVRREQPRCGGGTTQLIHLQWREPLRRSEIAGGPQPAARLEVWEVGIRKPDALKQNGTSTREGAPPLVTFPPKVLLADPRIKLT